MNLKGQDMVGMITFNDEINILSLRGSKPKVSNLLFPFKEEILRLSMKDRAHIMGLESFD